MRTKTEHIHIVLTPEERAAFDELAHMWHADRSAAILRAVYEARQRARQDAQLTAAWEKAQETK
jgi:hypothetical protein